MELICQIKFRICTDPGELKHAVTLAINPFGNGVGIQTDNLRTTDTNWFWTKGAVNNRARPGGLHWGLGGSPEVEVVGVGGPDPAAGDLREFFIREFRELFVQGFDFRFQDVQFFLCFHRYSSLDRYSNNFT